jgi:tetratricopeptide (TPR) repeat protein
MKPHRMRAPVLAAMFVAALAAMPAALAEELEDALLALQQRWAQAMYATADADARVDALAALTDEAAALAARHPERADPRIWEGIVLSTFAAERGGFPALRLAKQARERLEAALRIDPNALEGSAHTSLGALYLRVPRPPFGFGDQRQAAEHLLTALQQNPSGIDANFFYGEHLFLMRDHAGAVRHLEQALAAPPRPGRELADEGRRREAEALMRRVRAAMSEK